MSIGDRPSASAESFAQYLHELMNMSEGKLLLATITISLLQIHTRGCMSLLLKMSWWLEC